MQVIKTANGTKTVKVDPNLITVTELWGKKLIGEEDAKAAVDFINEIEKTFKAERRGDGVLNKFEVEKVVKYTERVFVPTSTTYTGGYKSESGDWTTVEKEERMRVFFIQHSTAYGKDEILYSSGTYRDYYSQMDRSLYREYPNPPQVISLEEILAVRDALSK